MLAFLTSHLPRKPRADDQKIYYDDGASIAWFKKQVDFTPDSPGLALVAVNRLPPASPTAFRDAGNPSAYPGVANTALGPPLHYHIVQDETFIVKEGQAAFYTFPHLPFWASPSAKYGKVELLGAGDRLDIPKRVVHTFRNASSEQHLELEFTLTPAIEFVSDRYRNSVGQAEEAYFRNVWAYRDDCNRYGLERSLMQVACFNHPVRAVTMFPGCGGIITNCLVNQLLALIGYWILGYRAVYAEYAKGINEFNVARAKKT